MTKEIMGVPGGPEKPENETETGLKDMRRYAELEFEGEVASVNHVDDFGYPFEDGDVTAKVYEIELKSGEKILGVGGGWPLPLNNYYKQFSVPEQAANFHLYTIAKQFNVYDNDEDLKAYADWLEIPSEHRQ